jgi:hypothetical protein
MSQMPTDHIIQLLIAERDRINGAIEALGGGTTTKRRGRPPRDPLANAPSWVTGKAEPPVKAKKHHMRNPAARKAQAQRMRAYWRKKKKAEKSA